MLDTELTIRTAAGERITRRLSDLVREEWAERLTVVTADATVLAAQAEHLGGEYDVATGWQLMEGETI